MGFQRYDSARAGGGALPVIMSIIRSSEKPFGGTPSTAGPPNNEGSLEGAAEAATPVSHAQSEGTWRDSCNAYKG